MSAATLPFLLDSWAAERPDAVAIAALSRPPLSYPAFAAASRRVAEGLSRQGIGPGDRVAMLLPNRPEVAVLLMALARLSAIAVPLDTRFGMEEIAGFLSRARVSAVATGWAHGQGALPRKLAEVLPDSRAPLRFLVGLDAGGVEALAGLPVLPWKSLDAMPEHVGEEARAEAAFLALPAAGGRLALHSQQGVASHARAVAERLGLEARASAVLPALPFATPTGLAAMMATLLSGGRLLCQEEEGAAAADSLARAHGATHLLGWPGVLAGMAPLAARRPYAALAFAGCAGALPEGVEALPLQQIWGMAETQGVFAVAADGVLAPVPPAELRVGEGLEIQSPSLLVGWLGEDACADADGFFRTGLPATAGAAGFSLTGVAADGGFSLEDLAILPAEVSQFLAHQAGVEEAAVVAASPTGPLVGFVRAVPDAVIDEAGLISLCQQALAGPKVPARIAVVETLPAPGALVAAANALLVADTEA